MRRTLVVVAAMLVLVGVAGVAVARTTPSLTAGGPTSVSGTDATAVFTVGDRTVRQIRYDDRGVLRYTFTLRNEGRMPVTLRGEPSLEPDARLFRFLSLTDPSGGTTIRLGAGESTPVTLALRMTNCETLSARAGSFMTEVVVRADWAGMFSRDVTVLLPEQVHTGSPREAFCPRSTATSRPPG